MDCPICEIKLNPTRYSSVRIFACQKCRGTLVEKHRVTTIERRLGKNIEGLVEEIVLDPNNDTQESIRCPRCRDRMVKQVLKTRRAFTQDTCRNCDAVWLDGGELAEIQLAYESSAQTQEVNKMRERLASMTDAEKSEFESRIAELVEVGEPITEATRQAVWELCVISYARNFWRF